ncbi:hypothetical protein IMG5_167770 [Ichthyophthirius multifiliis]|uniref:Piezo non-specific cation channel R-Ras-binding domain-containing protein n=1 Tax=Ichthyophthirius multifiliis TaxID=5932 RepID=G0R103_ICHMU|nr:hypothetical protein IMG5_167770 [Ichthyophthirius multifiliis]EGR28868.1 hypothetical protein IMG5_167770 [Ichthyophthirius multifiliis]|eukprot:XP_004030104.1 hypothetical protein IMG5_167770 [Ichthyophthirius multifiliis]
MDWAFSQTNLSLGQWFTLEQINYILYSAKMNSIFIMGQKVGELQGKANKILTGQLFLYRFELEPYSINNWDISEPAKNELASKLLDALKDPINGPKLGFQKLIPKEQSFYYPLNSQSKDKQQIKFLSTDYVQKLYALIADCKEIPVKLPNFYSNVLYLRSYEQSFETHPYLNEQFIQSIYINLACINPKDPQNSQTYWTVSKDPITKEGLDFFVLSDKYSNITFGFSIITIYTSVILVIGKFLRDAFSGSVQNIIFTCMPNPDLLLTLCNSIAYARTEGDFVKENILYYELMDLIRSPEMLKKLTGSYAQALTQKYKMQVLQEIKEQKEKEQVKIKNEN